jgi:hypothetical protein
MSDVGPKTRLFTIGAGWWEFKWKSTGPFFQAFLYSPDGKMVDVFGAGPGSSGSLVPVEMPQTPPARHKPSRRSERQGTGRSLLFVTRGVTPPDFPMARSFDLLLNLLTLMAGEEGLEPPTPGFGDRCSNQLSYTPTRARF